MIILYEESETVFDTLGIGVLKDAISCDVKEELNGSFELEMVYPIDGNHYKDISLRKIIFTKPNKFDDPQAFRIYQISKPFDGKVTVNAEHLSYDLSGYMVTPFDAEVTGITEALSTLQSKILFNDTFPFTFSTDIQNTESKFNIQIPATVRSTLAGKEGSLLDVFGGEYKFNNYEVSLLKHRGEDRGFAVRYAKNMTDIKQELKSEKLYTHVYPYYYRIVSETDTTTDKTYQKMYVRTAAPGEEPIEPFTQNWLSLNADGTPFTPIIKDIAVQIATEGQYKDKIYIWTDVEQEDGSTITKYVEVSSTDYPPNVPNPISTTTEKTEMATMDGNVVPITGRENVTPKRILSLDLTNYFDEKPTSEQLEEKAKEYIKNNKIGDVVETVEASFIKIDDPSINECMCLLGDTVTVYFGKLGVSSSLQVISTTYDVLAERYSEIGLGKKESTLSDNTISIGDDISSLNNDANYTDELKVGQLIASTITADLIEATNANFTNAQITTLQSDKIITEGIIQAAEGAIDTLVAELLVADNAAIKETLTVGEGLVVNGEINVKGGTISIVKDDNIDFIRGYIDKAEDEDINKKYKEHWLKTSYNGTESIVPEAGKIYKVYDIYNVWTQNYYEWDSTNQLYNIKFIMPEICFEVDEEGNLTANSADIKGKITATSGDIGGCSIVNGQLQVDAAHIISINADDITSGTITAAEIRLANTQQQTSLSIDTDGNLECNSVTLEGGTIENLTITGNIFFDDLAHNNYYISTSGIKLPEFSVENGVATFSGTLSAPDGNIGGFTIDSNELISSTSTKEVGMSSAESSDNAFWAGKANVLGEYPFSVTHTGYLLSTSGNIAGFQITNNSIIKEKSGSSAKLALYSNNYPRIEITNDRGDTSVISSSTIEINSIQATRLEIDQDDGRVYFPAWTGDGPSADSNLYKPALIGHRNDSGGDSQIIMFGVTGTIPENNTYTINLLDNDLYIFHGVACFGSDENNDEGNIICWCSDGVMYIKNYAQAAIANWIAFCYKTN